MACLENNDGYTWQDELDKSFGLKPLAHAHRVKTGSRRDNDKLRKRSAKYILARTMEKMRRNTNQGKQNSGWKKPRPEHDIILYCNTPLVQL